MLLENKEKRLLAVQKNLLAKILKYWHNHEQIIKTTKMA